jgi:hypothetical protein
VEVDGGTASAAPWAQGSTTTLRTRALSVAELAWLLAPLCAALLVAAILELGEPLGRMLEPSHVPATWNYTYFEPLPEPTEHARFLIALLGPLLLSGAVVLAARRRLALPAPLTLAARYGAEALLLAFVLGAGVLGQHAVVYTEVYGGVVDRDYFTWPTLAASLAIAVMLAVAIGVRGVGERFARWTAETRGRRWLGFALAALLTALWLLTAVQFDRSSGGTNDAVTVSMPYWLNETYAVLNGRTPLVDFNPQYSNLWPFIAATSLSLFGTTLMAYTITMVSGSLAALLAVFAVLRRVLGSSLAALLAYVPIVATSFFAQLGPMENRYGPSNLFSIMPMRYSGAYLLAWLTARHLDGARPLRRWALFAVGGAVVLNNPEFGIPALGATLAALVWTLPRWSPGALARLLGAAAVGTLGGAALVLALLSLRAGALPDLSMLTFYPRLYGVTGFGMLPMPSYGFHLAVYATFVGAIVVATTRAVAGRRDVLTGLLVFTGTFGLGASSYFAGRSHPEVLINLFSIWAFALLLLLIVVVRAIRARPARWPTPAELAVLLGVGIAVCSIAQTPTPWSQVERLTRTGDRRPYYIRDEVERFVAAHARPGERVAILIVPSHQIAEDAGVVNVARYAGWEAMPLKEQLQHTIDQLKREGGRRLYLPGSRAGPGELEDLLRRNGLEYTDEGMLATEFVLRRGN